MAWLLWVGRWVSAALSAGFTNPAPSDASSAAQRRQRDYSTSCFACRECALIEVLLPGGVFLSTARDRVNEYNSERQRSLDRSVYPLKSDSQRTRSGACARFQRLAFC